MGCSDSKENLKEQIEEESGGQITRDCVGNIFNVTGFTSQELFNAWTMYKSLVSSKSYKISNRKLLELPIINVSPFGYHFLEAFDLCGVQSSKEKENASQNDNNNDDEEEDDFDKNESETSKRKKRQIEGEIINIKARQRRPPQRFKSCLNDKKEHITFEMFCNILYFFSEHASFDEKCAVMFKLYDFDNDGKITMRDIETYLFRIKADSSKKFLDAEEIEEYDPAMYPVVLDPQYLNDEELDAIEREQKENDERRRREKEKDYENEDEDEDDNKDKKDKKDKKKMNNEDAPGNAEDNDDDNGSNNESANPPRKKRFGFKKVLITPFPNPPPKNNKDDDDDEEDDNGSEKEKRPQMNETEDNDNEEENEDEDNNDKDKEAIKVNEDKKKEDEIQDELTKRLLEKLEALNPELQIAQIIMKESATNGRNYLDYFDFKFILEGTDTLPEYSHNLYLEEYKEEPRCHCPDYCCGDD